ncbi:MAG: hypothetical protein CMJ28_07040 [Phycisphaerae bacterium]|nr:hypothetical protein [Phycisphaerae bacterium]
MAPDIKKRVLVGTPMILALVGLFMLDSIAAEHGLGGLPPLLVGWVLICFGGYEAAQLLRSGGLAADRFLIPIGAVLLLTAMLAVHAGDASLIVLGIFGVTFPAAAMIRPVIEGDLGKATTTAAASTGITVYLGAGLGSIFALLQDAGAVVALMAVLAIKSCDIGAYFTGHWLGRTPLAPSVSPAKTVEGLIGGMLFSALVLLLAGETTMLTASRGELVLTGLLLGALGQVGDLAESVWKRAAGAKDSGNGLPGIGGVLDVLDSPIFAGPFAWWMMRGFGTADGIG